VLSFVGSYTNLRGGHVYSSLIRKTEPKPLRVYLQDGRNDQNIYSGNWFIGNQDMASALAYAGYDSTFVIGDEGHNNKHGSAILPDALRWLWRDYPKPIAKPVAVGERQYIAMILDPRQGMGDGQPRPQVHRRSGRGSAWECVLHRHSQQPDP
jgi:hypothetical protein